MAVGAACSWHSMSRAVFPGCDGNKGQLIDEQMCCEKEWPLWPRVRCVFAASAPLVIKVQLNLNKTWIYILPCGPGRESCISTPAENSSPAQGAGKVSLIPLEHGVMCRAKMTPGLICVSRLPLQRREMRSDCLHCEVNLSLSVQLFYIQAAQ